MNNDSSHPIGVFDSGIGGLTVVKALQNYLPFENIVYFGDTARVPYGTKSPAVIREYTRDDTKILLNYNVKMIVVACNTVSAVALDVVQQLSSIPVIGMILPGSEEAVMKSKNKHIGIIGTNATIQSKAYENAIHLLDKESSSFSKPCPLFVPLAEEGLQNHTATELIGREYLTPLLQNKIDTLILGCTHYPLLRQTIQKIVGENINLIDSGEAAAKKVKNILEENNLLNLSDHLPLLQFFVSDAPEKIAQLGEAFLSKTLGVVRRIHIP